MLKRLYIVRLTAVTTGSHAHQLLHDATCAAVSNQASCPAWLLPTRCQDPALFTSLSQADKHFIVDRWVRRHCQEFSCDKEQSGAVIVITCVKTFQWHDTLMQCYNKNCAWLQTITEAVKEVCPLLTDTSTHSLTHSLTHPLTHSLIHSLARSLTHSLTHSLMVARI